MKRKLTMFFLLAVTFVTVPVNAKELLTEPSIDTPPSVIVLAAGPAGAAKRLL